MRQQKEKRCFSEQGKSITPKVLEASSANESSENYNPVLICKHPLLTECDILLFLDLGLFAGVDLQEQFQIGLVLGSIGVLLRLNQMLAVDIIDGLITVRVLNATSPDISKLKPFKLVKMSILTGS